MAETSFIFTSVETSPGVYDRLVNADNLRLMLSKIVGNGIYADTATNLQVVKPTGTDMIINISTGYGWNQGAFYINDTIKSFTLAVADGVNPRIDRVVMRFKLSDRLVTAEILTGTPAGTPVAPVLTRNSDVWELALADISISKGAICIYQNNITDQRINADLCGIVTGAFEQINATNLFAQFTSAFNNWFSGVQLTLSGDIAGNLLALINTNTASIVTINAGIAAEALAQKQIFGMKLGSQRILSGLQRMVYNDSIDANFKKITDYCEWNSTTNVVTFKKSGVYEIQAYSYIVDIGNDYADDIKYITSLKTSTSVAIGKPALEVSVPAMGGRNNEGYASMALVGLVSISAGDTAYIEVIPNHPSLYQLDAISQFVIFPKFFI